VTRDGAALDAKMNVFDLAAPAGNHQTGPGEDRLDANLTGDGEVSIFDLAHLANNYTGTTGPAGPVPEPTMLAILTGGALGLLRRRRHRLA